MIFMPRFYRLPLGLPLYWGDDPTGELPKAVRHYFDFCLGHCPDLTAEDLDISPMSPCELRIIIDYAGYFINAPCWETNLRDCEEMLYDLYQLRARARSLASVESIRRWNEECTELGIDPF